ncbi:Ig-like domain-containing protein [Acetobacterium wieringae]|uniref:Ig-like domain-containing protein n=1 Tax=Acetobacterium wieringae TaxID=52694 RepID=UPI002B1EEA77|nr:Ig-like domain-containing protein [Acetobacterium wieringae]MEA4805963.1 Ig-like domain-containing protein [Acetobacterium wieringae]
MKDVTTRKITTGMLFVIMVLSIFFSTGAFAANVVETDAVKTAEEIGVEYRGHVENIGDMPAGEDNFIAGPEALGTRGRSLRVEGFMIKLTGDVPEGAKIVYQVHVQNEGWMTPVENGEFGGTRGKSQRVESIRISLENLPGYDVYYRGHVQNVGDLPKVSGDWGWVKNGEELGTTGSSQRLEELQVKIVKHEDLTYSKAGTYGPRTGIKEVTDNVIINTPGVTLRNMHITGDLTIGEGVGEGDVTLNNVTVDGNTYVKGGGKNSIHINGGQYSTIIVQQTSSGQTRIVAVGTDGLEVVISEDAKGEDIILEGAFDSVKIEAPNVKVTTRGETQIKEFNIAAGASGAQVTLDSKTTVDKLVLDEKVAVKGQGTVKEADISKSGVTFEKAPVKQVVEPGVTPPIVATPAIPPVTPAPTPGGGGGGGSASVAVSGITVTGTGAATAITTNNGTLQMLATVLPANATNRKVIWSVEAGTGTASINTTGLLTAITDGKVTVLATAEDGSGKFGTVEITISNQAIEDKTYSEAGTYGPSTGIETINNAVVNAPGITLQNLNITGDLELGEGIGEGDVTLKNVTVHGTTVVRGGGEHSITVLNSILFTVIVNKQTGAVRILAEGATSIEEVQLESPATLEESGLTGGSNGFDNVTVTEDVQCTGNERVIMIGGFGTLSSRAPHARIELSEGTDLHSLILNALAEITGTGSIDRATINAIGSILTTRPDNMLLGEGVGVTIGDEDVTDSYSNESSAMIQEVAIDMTSARVMMDCFVAGLTGADFEVTATLDDVPYPLSNLQYNANQRRFTFDPVSLSGNLNKELKVTVKPATATTKLTGEPQTDAITVRSGFSGRVTDVQSVGVAAVTLSFRAGADPGVGDIIATAVTDADGYYSVFLEPGDYVATVTSNGFVTTFMYGNAPADSFGINRSTTAIRTTGMDSVRIVLTWGLDPTDEDSHLTGPTADGNGQFHTYYADKVYQHEGIRYADLDWDDITSYGPETTTIYQLVDGKYKFYVHNYSNNGVLVDSGAKVEVYHGREMTPVNTFNIPTDGSNTARYWMVFEMTVADGEIASITAVNELIDDNPYLAEVMAVINAGSATFQNYRDAEIYGVSEGNLADVNAAVTAAKTAKGSDLTRTEIQSAVDRVLEAAVVHINAGSATLQNYSNAGIFGVSADNLAAVNAAVTAAKALKGSDLTRAEVQTVVMNVYETEQVAVINAGTATVQDYTEAGILGVTADNLTAVNAAVAAAKERKSSDLTKTEIQQVVVDVLQTAAIAVINAGTATVQNYIAAGIIGVSELNLAEVNAAVAAAKAEKHSDLDKIEIQTAAIRVLETAAVAAINAGGATVQNYSDAGIFGVTELTLPAINAAVAAAKERKGSDLTKADILAIVEQDFMPISANVGDFVKFVKADTGQITCTRVTTPNQVDYPAVTGKYTFEVLPSAKVGAASGTALNVTPTTEGSIIRITDVTTGVIAYAPAEAGPLSERPVAQTATSAVEVTVATANGSYLVEEFVPGSCSVSADTVLTVTPTAAGSIIRITDVTTGVIAYAPAATGALSALPVDQTATSAVEVTVPTAGGTYLVEEILPTNVLFYNE